MRGIQYEDVVQAADALLHEGIRPTIERIRLRIGRGSPNTVSPMLEQWFSSLGKRLGGLDAPGQGADMPDAVLRAAKALWEKASVEAQMHSEQACAAERARLEGEAQQLTNTRIELEARERAMNERLKTMEGALQLCSRQLEESNLRWQASQHALAVQSTELAASQTALTHSREHAAALQQRLDQVQNRVKEEHAALEERHRQSEHRWLAEVDRARQEARKSTLVAQDRERTLGAFQQEADTLKAAHHAQALEQALQISSLRHELDSALHSAQQSDFLLQQAQQRTGPERSEHAFRPYTLIRRTPPVKRKLGKNRA